MPKCATHFKVWCAAAEATSAFSPRFAARRNPRRGARKAMAPKIAVSRRDFVKEAGGLLIGFSLADSSVLPRVLAAASPETIAAPPPSRLDSWLRIDKEGIVHVFTGKPEIG